MKLLDRQYRSWYLLLCVAFFTLMANAYQFNAEFYQALSAFYDEFDENALTIVIDPGHGGIDHGCKGSTTKEKDVNLNIAKKLSSLLKNSGLNVNVILTRDADRFVSLKDRIDIANANEGNLFLSIHCNSNSYEYVTGSETYIAGLDFINAFEHSHKEERLTRSQVKELELGDISKAQKMVYLKQSIDLATSVEKEFAIKLPFKSRGVREAGYTVLKYVRMPGILVETGFLSNKKQENYFNSNDGLNQIASSLAGAIEDFVETQVDRKVKFASQDHKTVSKHTLIQRKSVQPTLYKYSIELASNKERPLVEFDDKWSEIDSIEVLKQNNTYFYRVGQYTRVEDAQKDVQYLNEIGFDQAHIIKKPFTKEMD